MEQFRVVPRICKFDKVSDFCEEYQIGKGDLVFVSGGTYQKYFAGKMNDAIIVNYRKYGSGEPTDLMVEGIVSDLKEMEYKRVFAIGGGTVLDIAKLFALEKLSPVVELFEKAFPAQKKKKLILVPTTCGTGSEVTNISILELTTRNTKFGLACDELYADDAVLIPELLKDLPFAFFATSSIDALIHSMESFTSPKATDFTKIYSMKAMELILTGYQMIEKYGESARDNCLNQMLLASTYAGIAFGNAGCAAVHAMSYPLGAKYHVPHGEANYVIFTEVYKTYQKINPEGAVFRELNLFLAKQLECDEQEVYDELDRLIGFLLKKKKLSEYGVTKEEIHEFTKSVMEKQGRLMANNYVELDEAKVKAIYEAVF